MSDRVDPDRPDPEPIGGGRPLPLAGVVVLDLGQIYQGPYAGLLLALAGARVIKVEQRHGEPLRARGPSLPYAMLNSAKEVVTVDLKQPDGVDLVHRLAARADVVLVNYAPGVPERLGIGYHDLRTVNPGLIFAHATGFGLDHGADRADPGDPVDQGAAIPAMDLTVQAHMGVMDVTGFPDQGPVKSGAAFIDFLGGTHLYGAIVTALYDRERTGQGRLVEVSMADATYFTLCSNLGNWHRRGEAPRTGNRHAALGVAPYGVYRCTDGHVALNAVTDGHWRSILAVMGRADLIGDERYATNRDRVAVMDTVDELIETWTTTQPAAQAAAALQAAHVPAAAARSVAQVVDDPHQHARGALRWVDHPELGSVPLPHSPIRYEGSELLPLDPSRPVGADNDRVYAELVGLDPGQLADLRRRQVI